LLRAQVKFLILGIDFLKHFELMVDPATPSLQLHQPSTTPSAQHHLRPAGAIMLP
jgi:hypothetical protein